MYKMQFLKPNLSKSKLRDGNGNNSGNLKPKPKIKFTGFEVERVPLGCGDHPKTSGMEMGVVSEHPSRTLVIGGSGSGKSNAVIYSLLCTDLYGGYFDEIYLFASTAGSDPLFEHLGLPDECVFDNDLIDNCRNLFDKIKKEVEGMKETDKPKRLVIFEDISCELKFLRSQELREAFTQSRHYGVSIMAIAHGYKVIPPVGRESTERLWLYPVNAEELDKVCEAWTPAGMSKKEFAKFLSDAFQSFPNVKKPFIQIDRPHKKFYMRFDQRLEWVPL